MSGGGADKILSGGPICPVPSARVFGLPDTWKSDILASVIGSSHFISAGTVVRVRPA